MQLSSVLRRRGLLAALLLAAATPYLVIAQSDTATSHESAFQADDERLRGLVRPSKQLKLNAPLDGLLASVDVEEGQTIQAGQQLAKMDDTIQKLIVTGSKLKAADDSDIRKQTMLLGESEIQLERMQGLNETGAAQEWEVRRSKLQRDAAEASLDAAKSQKKLAEESVKLEQAKLERYTLVAPFDGKVVRIDIQAGSTVTNRDSIMTLFQLDPIEAVVFLPIELYGKLQLGQNYQFVAEAPVSAKLTGKLKTIEPLIDSASRTFRCIFTVDNPNQKLPAGFTVRFVWPQDL